MVIVNLDTSQRIGLGIVDWVSSMEYLFKWAFFLCWRFKKMRNRKPLVTGGDRKRRESYGCR